MKEDKFLNFIGKHSPKVILFILCFQIIMFVQYFWNHKVWEFGFLGLCISITLVMWYWIYERNN